MMPHVRSGPQKRAYTGRQWSAEAVVGRSLHLRRRNFENPTGATLKKALASC